MSATDDKVTQEVTRLSIECLDGCVARIRHCVSQLTPDQVRWRPLEEMNSIANLILHLTGNVRQWIVSGIGGAQDIRYRPAEFSERAPIPPEQLLTDLQAVVDDAKVALLTASTEELLQHRRIQGSTVNGFEALFDCIPHFKGHTQEINCLTRMQLGQAYTFYWEPAAAEQGAG
jgi:hypothetical protein